MNMLADDAALSEINRDRVHAAEDIRLAEMVSAAFRALLAGNETAARKHLAEAQQAHYALKPWRPGIPTRDACGNGLVFEEPGERYGVACVRPSGAHIRTDQGQRGNTAPTMRFSALGPTHEEAIAVMFDYLQARDIRRVLWAVKEPMQTGWTRIRVRHDF